MIHSQQIRAARVLLGWRQEDLAKASKVGLATLQRIEQQSGLAKANTATLFRLQKALEERGVRFIGEDETGGIGVRLAR